MCLCVCVCAQVLGTLTSNTAVYDVILMDIGLPGQSGLDTAREVRGRGIFLRASPVDVSDELRGGLFGEPRPVVLTSATLAAGGDTSFFQRRVGLPGGREESAARGVVLRPLACDSRWHDFSNPAKYIAVGRRVAEENLSELKQLVNRKEPHHEPATPHHELAAAA